MTDVRDKDRDAAALKNMAGNDTCAIVSKAFPFMPKVDMTRSFFAAEEVEGRISP